MDKLNGALLRVIDAFASIIPQVSPSPAQLKSAKLIAHRGVFDNKVILENTLPAFERAEKAGVWGIECDIRWTKDNEPVVLHDATCRRVFQQSIAPKNCTLEALKRQVPLLPTLKEVVETFGKRLHLMLELKERMHGDMDAQKAKLQACLLPLMPVEDYHFLSFRTERFDDLHFLPSKTFLPIANFFTGHLMHEIETKRYGGMVGHYYVLHHHRVKKLIEKGFFVGSGIIASRNVLFHELNKGVAWLFTSDPNKMNRHLSR